MNLTNHAIENCSVTGEAESVFNVLVLEIPLPSPHPKQILVKFYILDKALTPIKASV